jgi:hypothetical protein
MSGSRIAILGIGATLLVVAVSVFGSRRGPRERRTPVDSVDAINAASMAEAPPPVAPAPVAPAPEPVGSLVVLPQPPEREPRRPEARPAPTPVDVPELPDDGSILSRLHELAASNPQESLRLARAALERSPASTSAPEFDWNVVKALYNMGRVDEASDEARRMVRNYPDSEFSVDVIRHLLNPQPNP